jgi:NitT/TauT family transport system substrate-binding protein
MICAAFTGDTMKMLSIVLLGLWASLISVPAATAGDTIRVGHFPNVTHIQALVAHHLTRTGKGWFESRLGKDVTVEWFVYNAGPSAMEALLANSIDLTYVGPSPALNAYAKSDGGEIRIVAGAAAGGTALVIQPDSRLRLPKDFRGKTIATPQLGNTQDIACRAWLASGGLKITQMGGDAFVVPTPNPDQLALFQQKKIDAVWTVEPWVSRLERDAGGKILVERPHESITVLVSGVKFVKSNRDAAKKFVRAHRELTEWIRAHPEEAREMARQELAAETRTEISPDLIARAWKRITLTTDITVDEFRHFLENAQRAGFLRTVPDLSRLIDRLS